MPTKGQKRTRDGDGYVTAETVLLPSDRLLLETMLAEAVRPRISFSDEELVKMLSRLHADRLHYIHDRRSIPAAAAIDQKKARRQFCDTLEDICPLVTQDEFYAEQRRVEDMASAIRNVLSEKKNLSQDRKDQCIADCCCVWEVTWSAAVDRGLKALRVTTLGTVRDAFETHTLAVSVCAPVRKLLNEHNARLMVSANAKDEFVVGNCYDMRFVHPVHGRIVPPRYSCEPLRHSRNSHQNNESNTTIRTQRQSLLLLVCGASGAGKTMASLYFAVTEAEDEEEEEEHLHHRRGLPVDTPVCRDRADGRCDVAGDDDDDSEAEEEENEENMSRRRRTLRRRRPTDTDDNDRTLSDDDSATTCVFYCKARDFSKGDSGATRDDFERFVKAKLLLGDDPKHVTAEGAVVRSLRCAVVIVIDELGGQELFVSNLINHYTALTEQLARELQVDAVRIIGAGTGVDAFDQWTVKSEGGLRRVITRRIQTALWDSLSKHVASEHPTFLFPDLCKIIAQFSVCAADPVTVSGGGGGGGGAALSWLRAALANARFAALFATRLMKNISSTQKAAALGSSGFLGSSDVWDPLAMEANAAEGGLHFLALTTMHDLVMRGGLKLASSLFFALRNAIGAMIDREPPSKIRSNYFYWRTNIVSYGIVTLGRGLIDGTTLSSTTRIRRGSGKKTAEVNGVVVLRSLCIPAPPPAGTKSTSKCDDGEGDGASSHSSSCEWVDGFVEGAERYEVMRRGRPFFMVDRVYCSMCMLLFGGSGSTSTAAAFRPLRWRCDLERAVMEFAFFAASLPCVNLLEEERVGVPPLRRLLNQLGNEESAAMGVPAWQAAPPMRIGADTDWASLHVVVRAEENVTPKSIKQEEKEDSPQQQQSSFWRELRRCVRRGRAGVVTNTCSSNGTSEGANGFVLAQKLLALLQFKSCCGKTRHVVDPTMVANALADMAPVLCHRDCVLVVEAAPKLGTRQVRGRSAKGSVAKTDQENKRKNKKNKEELDNHQIPDRWKQQRVSEELVALACGVTFRRCPQTQRALVRTPTTTDTTTNTTGTTDTAASASPDFVVHVAAVFEGSPTPALEKQVLHNALGPQWADLEGSCSGPFAAAATTAANATSLNATTPHQDRQCVEVVLDYLLEEEAPAPDDEKAPWIPPRRWPLHVDRARSDVLRVAYRYFLVDVTWRKDDDTAEQKKEKREEGDEREEEDLAPAGIRSETCLFAWDDALPPLYPVAQTLFPARQ